jgi:glycolate oxidase FAD binding subunit
MILQPTSPEELQSIVKSQQSLLPRGGGTKPALSTLRNGATQLDMSRLSGMIEYEPDEYTFTAFAGTPVCDVAADLAKHGQYLPFDPMLAETGATLGGTVAANTSGPGRYRFGGVRDFILGLHFVDGRGQLVRTGGKAVKNSAGFDLPKFMVGSLGCFGVFVDLTFKVFPAPRSNLTLSLTYPNLEAALAATYRLVTAPFDMEALDLEPLASDQTAVAIRIGGLSEALLARLAHIQDFLKHEAVEPVTAVVVEGEAEVELWRQVREFSWVADGLRLIKVPIPPKRIPILEANRSERPLPRRYSVGGNVAWLAVEDIGALGATLTELDLAGMVLFGPPGQPYIGVRKGMVLTDRVKRALDPSGSFLDA